MTTEQNTQRLLAIKARMLAYRVKYGAEFSPRGHYLVGYVLGLVERDLRRAKEGARA